MSTAKPAPRSRPTPSTSPNMPHPEERQGYRRGRAIRSCMECRRRKMRCNRSRPCQNCNRFCRECVYLPFPEWPSGAPSSANEEGATQSPDQSRGRAHPSFDSNHHAGLGQTSPLPFHRHVSDLDSPVYHDGPYDNDADDEPLDLVLQIGRLSAITEKIARFWKPLVTDQMSAISQSDYIVGQNHHQSAYGIPALQHLLHPVTPSTLVLVKRIPPLEPLPGFLATTTQHLLSRPGLQLPIRDELQSLYHQYWSAVDPLTHIIHRPSFEGEFCRYLLHGQIVEDAPVSFKALLLAMCLAAAVSLPLGQAEKISGVTQQTLVDRLKVATEMALTDAGFMNSTRLQTLQAFTVYLIPQCRGEISQSHTVYVGALIRLTMSAGLNRDPNGSGISPIECQVRRLLWHQVCFLDLITTEAQGARSAIHDDQFNTGLPLNVNDNALNWPGNESLPVSGWTDATFSLILYECCMVIRFVHAQRLAVERGQTDLKTAQSLVVEQEYRIERKYLRNLDEGIPIQRCAKLVGRLFTARFDTVLLARHWQPDVKNEYDMNIRETLIESCLVVCECGVALDADPALAPWGWYARASHHYHDSIYLLMEILRDPFAPHAERINRVLDHVFGATPNLSSKDRSRNTLSLLAEELTKMMAQVRRINHPPLTASDTGSSSGDDARPGMMIKQEDTTEQWTNWQPELTYGSAYRHDLPAVTDDVWWPIPVQPSAGLCDSAAPPQYGGYTGPPYGYGMGSGPV